MNCYLSSVRILRTLLILLITFYACSKGSAKPMSSEKVKSYTQEEVRAYFDEKGMKKVIVPSNNGIDVYRILYEMNDIQNQPTTVSGLFLVPQGTSKPLALLSYQHGTNLAKEDAPSISFKREYAIAMLFAADGYAVCMPDYLGLGISEGYHPYMHTESEAGATIGLIEAVRVNYAEFGIKLNGMLFLTGYSQGGHATMATHMVIERDFANELVVTASAPMSGVYDLSGVQSDFIFKRWKKTHIAYLPYLIFAYNEIYGFTDSPAEYFKPPYDTLLPPLFDGTHPFYALVWLLPRNPLLFIQDTVWNSFVENPKDQFRLALQDNNVYKWLPNQPVMMCYCKGDRQINWRNAEVASEWMNEHGAASVISLKVGRKFGHRKCAYFAPVYVKWWFDGFREGQEQGGKGPGGKRFLLSIAKIFMSKY